MALTAGLTGSGATAGTSAEIAMNADETVALSCPTIMIECSLAAGNPALVNIPLLHGTATLALALGAREYFTVPCVGSPRINISCAAATTTVTWGVVGSKP